MEPKYKIDPERVSLHISKGNSKIGREIYSFSTLPGNAEHMIELRDGTLLTDIPGTCSKYCEECARDGACYAWRDAKLHHNATIPAWGENTLLLRSWRLWGELDTYLTLKNGKAKKYLSEVLQCGLDPELALRNARALAVVKYFRIHVSGELESADQLRRWNDLAFKHPETIFAMYTKNFDALAEFFDVRGQLADNLVVNVSEWHGVAKAFLDAHPGCGLNVFEYDDSLRKDCGLNEAEKERLAKTIHCPAVNAKGRHAKRPDGTPVQCSQCLRCYRKTGKTTAVYAH